jgi:polysaccharide export outer membrane protein
MRLTAVLIPAWTLSLTTLATLGAAEEAPAEDPLAGRTVEIIEAPVVDAAFLAETSYRVGPDDKINITVLDHPELSGAYFVDPEGYLNLPMLEDFRAAGLTVRQLREALADGWRPYLGRLQLGLQVLEYNSCRVYILGEVTKPGRYGYRVGISLIEALSQAGGLNEHAVSGEVAVVRVLPETTKLYLVDVDDILEGGGTNWDIPLGSGDIVYVSRSFIGDWNAFLGSLSPTIASVISLNRLYYLNW